MKVSELREKMRLMPDCCEVYICADNGQATMKTRDVEYNYIAKDDLGKNDVEVVHPDDMDEENNVYVPIVVIWANV